MSGRLLTLGEVAELFAVSPRTARRWIASGELPVFRQGRLVRVRERDAHAFLVARILVSPASRSDTSGVVRRGERLWD